MSLHSLLALTALVAMITGTIASAQNYSRNHASAQYSCDGLHSRRCPFDDLSASEIRKVVRAINFSGIFPDTTSIRFSIVRMQEPSKTDWLSGASSGRARRAFAAVFDKTTNSITELLVDLDSHPARVLSTIELPVGLTPPLMTDEYVEAEELIRADPAWQAAVRLRGVEPDDCRLDIWAPGTLAPAEEGGDKRILRVITNYQDRSSRFWYWIVLEGLIVHVDLQQRVVTQVWDDGVTPLTSGFKEKPNSDDPPLKPLLTLQPQGSSLRVEGQGLAWYKWRLRYSVHPIVGLQLFHVTYEGDCYQRTVAYKISIGELFVPYGALGRTWRWRNAFDAGEYGLGKVAVELKRGIDVPENSHLFECIIANESGEDDPKTLHGCVAAYERDAGLLYKHVDTNTGDADGRRGQDLVLTFGTTIGNYDYFFDYVLHMDGTIQVLVRLSGIVLARGVPQATNDPNCVSDCANLLHEYIVGPPHQHFFNFRIDLDVDGPRNQFMFVDLISQPSGPDNVDGGAFIPMPEQVEGETWFNYDTFNHRTWHMINKRSRNRFGTPRGYALRPDSFPSFTYMDNANPPFTDGKEWVRHPIWITRYKDNEQRAADEYPRTGRPGEGLPKYVADLESVVDEDLVLWYSFGITHSPRPEEWPIMTMHSVGFSLVPFNFLSHNAEMAVKGQCP